MTAKRVLVALIIVTAAVFAFIYAASQDYWLAVLAVGLGLGWLVLETKGQRSVGTLFFIAFAALAIAASLRHAAVTAVLLGLSADLAAWDISRFSARIVGETANEAAAFLEMKHLQKLAVTAGAGFFIALLPVFIQISISFIVLLLVILVMIIALRQSMLYLRNDRAD